MLYGVRTQEILKHGLDVDVLRYVSHLFLSRRNIMSKKYFGPQAVDQIDGPHKVKR